MSEAQSVQINDTPLVSMILVDDNNNRTTFNGPIINDFTITEDLQEKITQLTTLATNIGNLQTRLTNITNILNTQNIEFTDNVSDVSSAGSKLYIQPQVYLKLTGYSSSGSIVRYLNLTPYVTGKYKFTQGTSLNVTCSLGLDLDLNPSSWNITLGPNSIKGLTVNIGGTVNNIATLNINDSSFYESGILISNSIALRTNTTISLINTTGISGTINITFTE